MSDSRHTQIDANEWVRAVTFTVDGKQLVSGGEGSIQVWRVKDGERVATMQMDHSVWCVAVSKDGRFIAAGTKGEILVWDATTYEQVYAGKTEDVVLAIDFSPSNSSRLVSADHYDDTATIWDVAAGRVKTLSHSEAVNTAKYSPEGKRIATATRESIRVWDSDGRRLLVDVDVKVALCQDSLLWFNNHLLVIDKESKIKRIDVSTGSTVSEWFVHQSINHRSCIALPRHGKFVACSTEDNIAFWDTSTHTQLGLIPRRSERCSIAFSPDGQFLAIIAQQENIVIKSLSFITELDIRIDYAALNAWKHGDLTNAEALLTAAIPKSWNTAHHVLASRALIRARLRQWDAALVDAEESIKIQPSVVGYLAMYVVLVGNGDTHAACRMSDIALQYSHSNCLILFLLVKAVVLFMAREHNDAISRIDNLIQVVHFDSTLYVVQAHMYFLLGNLHMGNGDYELAIQSFDDARVKLGDCTDQLPMIVFLISGWKFDDLAIKIQQQSCEALLSAGRAREAGESALCLMDRVANMEVPMEMWVSDFIQKCLSTPEDNDDTSGQDTRNINAPMPRHASHPLIPTLRQWAKLRLETGTWNDALATAAGFTLPRSTIYQVICEYLETAGHVEDAIACFHQMRGKVGQNIDGEWAQVFSLRCHRKLENLGDTAMSAGQYDEAVSKYTIALSLHIPAPQDVLVKRSKAYAGEGLWEDALNDANEIVRTNPSSPLGYERKHAALHGLGRYDDATAAFDTMLLKILQSSDPETRDRFHHYVKRQQTEEKICKAIQDIIRDSPPVLINTISGRLCSKSEQAAAFESQPALMKLISSMTTHIDHTSIEDEVGKFYRYATFSHKWQENEPLYEKVISIVVYDLEASTTHEKLQMFCKIVREAGFNWAWSDTCCIDKSNHFVLQEALVSMFRWYEGSAMTIIFLLGVDRLARRGALTRSIWNMRAWTLQEYHASKVVRIYTEDWTPYLGLTIYNHKDSPDVTSEMEQATGISAQVLKELCPGLDDIREKLCLASTRQATLVEDVAYSLFGIFSLSSLPVVYGEGHKALGRLLAQLLTDSGDTSILAWTGTSNSYNSCLPASITVFSQPPTTHIPPATPDHRMQTIPTELRLLNPDMVTKLYDRVNELSAPFFVGRRMKLPCLTFKLGQVTQRRSERTFYAQAKALGVVKIRTEDDLSRLDSLYLVHPWIDFLLDRQSLGNIMETIPEEDTDDRSSVLSERSSIPGPSDTVSAPRRTQRARLMSRLPFGGSSVSLVTPPPPPSIISSSEKQMRALQFIARLKHPFGALLLTPTRRNMEEYKRVATESLIEVQVGELTLAILDSLVNGVRTLDVL